MRTYSPTWLSIFPVFKQMFPYKSKVPMCGYTCYVSYLSSIVSPKQCVIAEVKPGMLFKCTQALLAKAPRSQSKKVI